MSPYRSESLRSDAIAVPGVRTDEDDNLVEVSGELVPAEAVEIAQNRWTDADWDLLNSCTRLQRRFVMEYPIDMNATRAAERAGYQGKDFKSYQVIGFRLLRHPKVNPLIRKLTASTAEEMGITREWILSEIREVAMDLKESNDSAAVKALETLARLRGDLIERVESKVAHVHVELNGVDMDKLT